MSHTEGSENLTAEAGDPPAAHSAPTVTQTTPAVDDPTAQAALPATQTIAVDEGVRCP
jgi:hypothetical protein